MKSRARRSAGSGGFQKKFRHSHARALATLTWAPHWTWRELIACSACLNRSNVVGDQTSVIITCAFVSKEQCFFLFEESG
eukprot:3334978-Amphidinium_carterae.1